MDIQHQEIKKQQQKAWHNQSIKNKNLSVGDLALLYNSWVKGKPKKLHIEWMGPYIVEEINANRLATENVTRHNISETGKLCHTKAVPKLKNLKKKVS